MSEKVAMHSKALVDDFLAFVNEAWTPFHATAEARRRLLAAGFKELSEAVPVHDVQACSQIFVSSLLQLSDSTVTAYERQLKPGGKYFVTRNMSAIAAFAVGGEYKHGDGFVILGAHTDSPCPKLKPVSKSSKCGYIQVATQPYGGGLWHTWFDRDLGIAGRVIVRRGPGRYSHDLVKIEKPVLRIPTLAIHLTKASDRGSFAPNLQDNFYPVLATEVKAKLGAPENHPSGDVASSPVGVVANGEHKGMENSCDGEGGSDDRHHAVLLGMLAEELGCAPGDVEDFELQLCDVQPSCLGGASSEFVFSGRLDNLCSSWQSLRSIIDGCDSLASSRGVRSIFLFDNEEVGSHSYQGAAGTLLPDCMRRIAGGLAGPGEQQVVMESIVQKSFLVSADMAHAVHPNYQSKHDPGLCPKLHGGMVLKHNANQRYATNAVTAFFFREIGRRAGLKVQEFAVRSDAGCGSTIGPALSTLSGIRTVDVGSPQLSMHSIREMMGVDDVVHGYWHLKGVLESFFELDEQLVVDAAL